MRAEQVLVVGPAELGESDRAFLDKQFRQDIFPVLTPLAIDPAHPFPFIPNLGLTVALQLSRNPLQVSVDAFIAGPGVEIHRLPPGGALGLDPLSALGLCPTRQKSQRP